MKKFFTLFALSSFFVTSAHAMGDGSMTGTGSATHEAEFVKLNFTILSECYDTPAEATRANKEQVLKLQQVLKNYVRADQATDDVTTAPGLSTRHTKTIYNEETRTHDTICANKYMRSTSVTFTTGDILGFDEKFDGIQEAVDTAFVASNSIALTSISMSSPVADVCAETRKEMRNLALDRATLDAKEKFAIAAKQCGINPNQINVINISDAPLDSYSPKSLNYESAMMPASSHHVVSYKFDKITDAREITLKFRFPEGKLCNQ